MGSRKPPREGGFFAFVNTGLFAQAPLHPPGAIGYTVDQIPKG